MTESLLIKVSLSLSVSAFLLSAAALAVSTLAILAWRRESKRNDDQDSALGKIGTTLDGFQAWMGNMQRTADSVNKQSLRIVGHLESERRTRADFSAQVYLMLDGICEKVGIETVQRETWRNSTLPIIKEMQEDIER